MLTQQERERMEMRSWRMAVHWKRVQRRPERRGHGTGGLGKGLEGRGRTLLLWGAHKSWGERKVWQPFLNERLPEGALAAHVHSKYCFRDPWIPCLPLPQSPEPIQALSGFGSTFCSHIAILRRRGDGGTPSHRQPGEGRSR